ncbi:copper chaperone PCu(A)C [Pseudomaricurvus alcaniphilus]|uniref:copper chaperone PCu(A)C n=1 Tax=Pseudomaricurvus alcaniphilus TaxID=1166482 RepID=UPI00140E6A7F|nr:copper chaperone PCu(A)C [Pseudomaricurvus alcaniphilus]NHN38906.1 copper chaperone PCu(A)C [Pseudomaricurvus alcaniphilus]
MTESMVNSAAGFRRGASCLLLALLLVLICQPGARAEMLVESARIRLPLPGQSTAVVYFDLHNRSARDQNLVAVAVEGAQRAEIHQHLHVDGLMQMRAVPELLVGAGESVVFQPHGYHVMVFAMTSLPASATDDQYALTLTFADGSTLRTFAQAFRY